MPSMHYDMQKSHNVTNTFEIGSFFGLSFSEIFPPDFSFLPMEIRHICSNGNDGAYYAGSCRIVFNSQSAPHFRVATEQEKSVEKLDEMLY